jgi:hypothetical protein
MKAEPYVVISSNVAIPARCIAALDELVNIETKYDSGYTYHLGSTAPVSLTHLSKDYVAGMIAEDKLK